MTEYERKKLAKLDLIITLLQGLGLENRGIRTHIASASDLHDGVLKDVIRQVREIREDDAKAIAKKTRPGDSR